MLPLLLVLLLLLLLLLVLQPACLRLLLLLPLLFMPHHVPAQHPEAVQGGVPEGRDDRVDGADVGEETCDLHGLAHLDVWWS